MAMHRILVVEDEVSAAFAISLHLGKFGHVMLGPASTGIEAVALARSEKPDLVLMDIQLLGPMDGVEAARSIRAEREVALIFMTAYPIELIKIRVEELHPLAVLSKPFGLEELEALIARI